MVFALEPFHCVEAFGILTDHVHFVFVMGFFLQAVSVQDVVTFSGIIMFHMNSFKSVEDWRRMMAGPGISVT